VATHGVCSGRASQEVGGPAVTSAETISGCTVLIFVPSQQCCSRWCSAWFILPCHMSLFQLQTAQATLCQSL
jgi:hypothetical protein